MMRTPGHLIQLDDEHVSIMDTRENRLIVQGFNSKTELQLSAAAQSPIV